MTKPLTLQVLPGRFAVCRLDANTEIPPLVLSEPFFAVMRTQDELSLLLPEQRIESGWKAETGWRILKVLGPLDFGMIGVLHSISAPLAEAGISIFVCSTYDTDYVLVKDTLLSETVSILQRDGFEVICL